MADQIQRDLSDLLRSEVKDPRIGLMTITEVEVTPDYAHAKVFYTRFPDSPEDIARCQAGLQACAGFLRGQLGRRLGIHQTPALHFHYDRSVAQGAAMSQLIEQALAVRSAEDPTPPRPEEDPGT